jgi:uncharacterized membrane protein YgdD (TMEM256/DUF423 family)
MNTPWIWLGAASGFVGVAMGAFGAHGLAERFDAKALAVFHTAAQYQMYHALALVAFGVWSERHAELIQAPGWAFALGTLIFSGSLYLLALTGVKWLGAITPIGGVFFLVGWGLIAWTALKLR